MTADQLRMDALVAIEARRQAIGISYAEMARRARKSPAYVSDVVHGRKVPGLRMLVDLADAVGLAMRWRFEGRS